MSVQTRTTRLMPDFARGLGATLGVLLLVAGVPIGLIAMVGWPLPAEVPTADDVTDALRDTYIPDAFLVKALAVVVWLVWVELVAALIVETIAYFRGKQAGRMPLTASSIQRAAARLVATSALLGALVATRGMPEIASRALRPPETVTLVVDEQQEQLTTEVEKTAAQTGAPAPVYEVQRRDTLWGIAESCLGDPFRWPEIYELNKGLPQADGRVLRDPDLIFPGWQLRLPADAIAPVPPQPEGVPVSTQPSPDPVSGGSSGKNEGMILVDDRQLDERVIEAEIAVNATRPGGAATGDVPGPGPGGMVLLSDDDLREGN